jgi:hypothetical protein
MQLPLPSERVGGVLSLFHLINQLVRLDHVAIQRRVLLAIHAKRNRHDLAIEHHGYVEAVAVLLIESGYRKPTPGDAATVALGR